MNSIQRYVIKFSVTCDRSVVFPGYSDFLHQKKWPPRYNWNIAEKVALITQQHYITGGCHRLYCCLLWLVIALEVIICKICDCFPCCYCLKFCWMRLSLLKCAMLEIVVNADIVRGCHLGYYWILRLYFCLVADACNDIDDIDDSPPQNCPGELMK